MSLYDNFKTNSDLETKGVEIDYGHCVITVARAGGANKKFERVLAAKTKPYRRAMDTETMDPGVAARIMRETYAEAIILRWQSRVGEDGNGDRILKAGIEAPEGGEKLLPFNEKNVAKTLQALPDLFTDIQGQANKFAIYREAILETEAGN
jgi:hypothetical protein